MKIKRRIIPTRMGTSWMCPKNTFAIWDHPHAYGDKWNTSPSCEGLLGSSPRVWGQVVLAYCLVCKHRIIPTRMGTSTRLHRKRNLLRDHPHAYGDKCSRIFMILRQTGSSPRVWGQAENWYNYTRQEGIIPTRMGTSFFVLLFFLLS